MSQHNIGYVPDEIRPSAPPESAVYDEVSRDSRGNSTPVVPPVYMKQTIITVQPHNQNGTNRAQRVPVPVNTTEWVSTPRSQLNPLIGTDFLNGIEQLEIQQTVQLSTLLGETKSGNQYRVKVPRAETIFLATETSTECQRDILGSSRGFSLTLTDPTGQDAFKFTKSPGWGCVPGFLHKMFVDCTDPIGSIEQNFTLLGPSFTVYNNARNPLCKIYGPNMFCCCISRDTQFQIVSVDGTHQIASLIRQWDHILLDYTITLTVPAGTNVNLKGLLLGAAFLLEYLYFSRLKKS
ncbi:phospholipid scramblase 2 isoform X1 [Neodiprion pinetum]|uniref:Phospholipid scramblase n=2 Tax=Neodiprion lecontei TaxID=441921 RepID=A0A6J0C7U4_NEOLC|nr:phospholipid scramblase 2 isoform X1 [Neodiprion lecontei]XP_046420323.1 phospholipid scramblase 2 isoform X1 [Neodiprion fabricii]XP_046476549.1 phospholipid scramblase 2 isoform X1 [Neodiprion pinetum]XP_046614149.1 phospholipid scramblase 2 isoform X1 [Neodiprion virginianus]